MKLGNDPRRISSLTDMHEESKALSFVQNEKEKAHKTVCPLIISKIKVNYIARNHSNTDISIQFYEIELIYGQNTLKCPFNDYDIKGSTINLINKDSQRVVLDVNEEIDNKDLINSFKQKVFKGKAIGLAEYFIKAGLRDYNLLSALDKLEDIEKDVIIEAKIILLRHEQKKYRKQNNKYQTYSGEY